MIVEFLSTMGMSPLAMKDCILYIGIIGCLLFAVGASLYATYIHVPKGTVIQEYKLDSGA